jgi:hypothetical protein
MHLTVDECRVAALAALRYPEGFGNVYLALPGELQSTYMAAFHLRVHPENLDKG